MEIIPLRCSERLLGPTQTCCVSKYFFVSYSKIGGP